MLWFNNLSLGCVFVCWIAVLGAEAAKNAVSFKNIPIAFYSVIANISIISIAPASE